MIGSPIMSQRWCDLMFLHFPVTRESLRRLVHPALTIEEFGGTPWVAVTPFRIEAMRAGPVPLPPFSMPELNVRTYVSDGERSGVWFFSLDAGSRLAVLGARLTYRLPYVYAEMHVEGNEAGRRYQSVRPDGTTFEAEAKPLGKAAPTAEGSFERWFAERYCLYSGKSDGPLYTADIDHAPWKLAEATVSIQRNDMLTVHGLSPAGEPAPPRLAEPLDVRIWPLRRAGPSPAIIQP